MCRHNPYFSRWFSAIHNTGIRKTMLPRVTILILVDGFLQYQSTFYNKRINYVTILILVDGFLQYSDTLFIDIFEQRSQSLF